jgi:conjugal transfer pilus assembly protein TraW
VTPPPVSGRSAGLLRRGVRRGLPALLATTLATATVPAPGADLGVRGPVYPIAEPDLLEALTAALREKERSGEIARRMSEGRARAAAHAVTPPPVPGLSRTVKARTVFYDPTIRVDEAIVDGGGRILVPAGTTANPLEVVSLSASLLFVDGRDGAQVRLAKAALEEGGAATKVVLVGGSPVRLARAWQRPVYFDQGGKLLAKFGIRHVPARLSQQGLQLRIDELVVGNDPDAEPAKGTSR